MLAPRVASKNRELRISPRKAVATTSAANVQASHAEPWSLLALQYFSHLFQSLHSSSKFVTGELRAQQVQSNLHSMHLCTLRSEHFLARRLL
jgi:hypothetical protein